MKTTVTHQNRKLLQTMYPDVYKYLVDKLSENNIHSFDVQITGRKIESSVEIHVRFGEGFAQELIRKFSEQEMHKPGNAIDDFCEEVQEKCQETLIADYFKMLRP